MEISDVRVKLIEDANDRLRAVCSVTFDEEFVVRDIKVVEGTHGLFVAMPSRKLSVHCPQCRHKNHLRAKFCNECGARLPVNRLATDANGRVRLHRDIAHPINPSFREMVQSRVIQSFETEMEASRLPGYRPAEVEEEEEPAEPVEPAEQPLHTDEPIEVTEEMTEYDALIAGLRGSPGGSRPGPDTARPAGGRGRGSSPSYSRPEPQRRPAQESPRPVSRPAPEPRRERPAPPPPRPQRAPAPLAETRPRERETFREEAPPSTRYVEAVEPPQEKAPPPPRPSVPREPRRSETPRPPATQPAVAPPAASESDTPFGQGIL